MRPEGRDALLRGLSVACAVAVALVAGLIAVFVAREALPALRTVGPRFVSDGAWRPAAGPEDPESGFGMLAMLAATLLSSAAALALAVPAGVVVAVFCRFYAPARVARWMRRLVQVLAGVPSVVFGLWGLVALVPWIRRLHPPGQSLLAAALVLALMILPTVALLADSALGAVPKSLLRGAASLGLDRYATVRGVVLPAARRGILAAAALAAARAVGETLAVVMVCGNVVQLPRSPFDPVRTLTANIVLEMGYATAAHRSALFVGGLLLFGAVALLVSVPWGLDRLRGGRRA